MSMVFPNYCKYVTISMKIVNAQMEYQIIVKILPHL